jgi:hypothetical protein
VSIPIDDHMGFLSVVVVFYLSALASSSDRMEREGTPDNPRGKTRVCFQEKVSSMKNNLILTVNCGKRVAFGIYFHNYCDNYYFSFCSRTDTCWYKN